MRPARRLLPDLSGRTCSRLLFWLRVGSLGLLPAACAEPAKVEWVSEAPTRPLGQPRGSISVCGPADQQFGAVDFAVSGTEASRTDFALGVALLHSFEYEAAEKVFGRIIRQDPGCVMAYWGVAMCKYHPLWTPPSPAELAQGAAAVAAARRRPAPTAREAAYLAAIGAFYQDYERTDHRPRALRFEQAMARVAARFPADEEAAIFHALALAAAADPADKSFATQRRAGAILQGLRPRAPRHPGLVHYLIHTYDYPELAALALPAAREYAAIAPSSAHAQHMPSHIFTRLGLWTEGIRSNAAAAAAARCYAESAALPGHWDEELHSLDYLIYAHLQQGDNALARQQLRYLASIRQVSPVTFKVAYALAAGPARYALENRQWAAAARLRPQQANLDWQRFPWQLAITHFARALGHARTAQPDSVRLDVQQLRTLRDTLAAQQNAYQAQQVQVQLLAAEAWLLLAQGQPAAALPRMQQAAALEARTEKHPVTPGEVLPARELLADLLLQLHRPAEALAAYEAALQQHPNRFNGLYGAAVAAQRAGDAPKARQYYQQLLRVAGAGQRPELAAARRFLAAPPSPAS